MLNSEESYCVAKGLNEWVYGKVTNGFQFYCIFIATLNTFPTHKKELSSEVGSEISFQFVLYDNNI